MLAVERVECAIYVEVLGGDWMEPLPLPAAAVVLYVQEIDGFL